MKCPNCNTELPPQAKFCFNCGTPTTAGRVATPTFPPSLFPTSSAVERAHIRFAVREERRNLTVLFCDLKGFTALSEKKDPELVRDLISELFSRLATIIRGRGGYVDKYIGDAVMALFGAPESHEDDPARAIDCALKIQDEIKNFNRQHSENLQLRIGINTGEVIWGEFADGGKTVMGDAVNVAQRLEGIARPGSVLVGSQTMKLAQRDFTFHILPAVAVKGRTELVQPYEVVSRIEIDPVRGVVRGLRSSMVGREDELETLRQTFELVRSQNVMRMVVILGDAGIGKSRLLYEFRNLIAELPEAIRFDSGRCIAWGQSGYWPLGEILRRRYLRGGSSPLRGEEAIARSETHQESTKTSLPADADEKIFLDAMMTEMRRLCISSKQGVIPATAFPVGEKRSRTMSRRRYREIELENFVHALGIAMAGLEYKDARVRALDAKGFAECLRLAFRAWLEAVTAEGPLILAIEDVHWSDPSTIEILRDAVEFCPDIPLMLIVLGRKEGAMNEFLSTQKPRLIRIELSPLSEEGTLQMARETLRCKIIEPELRRLLIEHGGGNPYYTEELLRYLTEGGFIRWYRTDEGGQGKNAAGLSNKAPSLVVPDTLNGLLGARLDALDPSTREVVSSASVIGRCFWKGAIQAILQRQVERELEFLTGCDIVFLRAESEIPGELEYIFKHALLRDAAYARLTKKLRRELHRLAAEWIKRRDHELGRGRIAALEAVHWEKAEEPQSALAAWTRAAEQTKDSSALESERYLSAAIEIARTATTDGEKGDCLLPLLEKRAKARITLGRLDAATDDLNECLAASCSPEARCRALRLLAEIDQTRGAIEAAQTRYHEALELPTHSAPLERARTLLGMAWLAGEIQGRFDYAQRLTSQAEEIALSLRSSADADEVEEVIAGCKRNSGIFALHQGRLTEAEGLFGEVMRYYEKRNDRRGAGAVSCNIGGVYYAKGELDRALECYQKDLAICEEIGDRRGVGIASGNIGNVYYAKGELDRALECYQKDLAISEEIGVRRGVGIASCNIGNVYYDKGELDRALEFQQKCLKISEEIGYKEGIISASSALASIMLSRGEYARAYEFCERGLEGAREMGAKSLECSAVSLKGRIIRKEAARMLVEEEIRTSKSETNSKSERGERTPRQTSSDTPLQEGNIPKPVTVGQSISLLAEGAKFAEALAMHRQALDIADKANLPPQERAGLVLELCEDAIEMGDELSARHYLEEAHRLTGKAGSGPIESGVSPGPFCPGGLQGVISGMQNFGLLVRLSAAQAHIELRFGDRSRADAQYQELISLLRSKGYHLLAKEMEEEIRNPKPEKNARRRRRDIR